MLDDKDMPDFDAVPSETYEEMLRELDSDEMAMEWMDEPEAQLPVAGETTHAIDSTFLNGDEEAARVREKREFFSARADLRTQLVATSDSKGAFLGFEACLHNLHKILTLDPRLSGALAYNEMSERPCFVKSVELSDDIDPIRVRPGATEDVRDEHIHDIRTWLSYPETRFGWGTGFKAPDMKPAISAAARRNRFHPVKAMFEKETWDGTPRIDTLGIRYLGMPDDAYSREIFRLVMLAMIARVYQPGHDFQLMLIIEGATQGSGKSTFVKTLAGGFYNEVEASDMKDARSKAEALVGSLIIEMPELTALRRLPEDEAKQLISRGAIKVRGAWGSQAELTLLQCVIIGTTNRRAYLVDPTGNRRMAPAKVHPRFTRFNRIDNEGLKAELPQLYAEALHEYHRLSAASADGTLDLNLSAEAAKIQERLTATAMVETEADTLHGRIEEILMTPTSIDPRSLTPAQMDKFFVEVEGEVYRRIWCREMIVRMLEAEGRDVTQLRTTAKNNDVAVALEKLVWIAPDAGKAKIPGYADLGRQNTLAIDTDAFAQALEARRAEEAADAAPF